MHCVQESINSDNSRRAYSTQRKVHRALTSCRAAGQGKHWPGASKRVSNIKHRIGLWIERMDVLHIKP